MLIKLVKITSYYYLVIYLCPHSPPSTFTYFLLWNVHWDNLRKKLENIELISMTKAHIELEGVQSKSNGESHKGGDNVGSS